MRPSSAWLLVVTTLFTTPQAPLGARAQSYSEVVVFGDSSVNSGYYRAFPDIGSTDPDYNALWPAAVAAGAGTPVTRPGLMNSEHIANYFGFDLKPSNQGGNNYATSGAKTVDVNSSVNGGPTRAIPPVTQIGNFLTERGNVASPTTLFLIQSGFNDTSFAMGRIGVGPHPGTAGQPAPSAYMAARGAALATAIRSLHAAGGRTFLVRALNQAFPLNDANERAVRAAFNDALFAGLASLGSAVIRSDFNPVRQAIIANRTAFGFSLIDNVVTSHACTLPAGIASGQSLLCSSAPGAPSTLQEPNADMTRLFADEAHFATQGQKLQANFDYDLLPQATSSPLVAAVLPSSRSVQVGNPATVFATIINAGTTALSGCRISPVTTVNGRFSFQTTNAANQLTGTVNTAATIAAGAAQNFLIAFTPTAAQASGDVRFVYVCAGVPSALPLTTVNTLRLSFDTNPVADMITIGVTPSNDGYARISGPTGAGLFVTSTVNIGAAATLMARVRLLDTATAMTATVCQTNPVNGQCLAPPAATVSATFANNVPTTWAAFLQATSDIPNDPARFRILFEYVDAGGVVRGSTSTAVTTVAADSRQLAAR